MTEKKNSFYCLHWIQFYQISLIPGFERECKLFVHICNSELHQNIKNIHPFTQLKLNTIPSQNNRSSMTPGRGKEVIGTLYSTSWS